MFWAAAGSEGERVFEGRDRGGGGWLRGGRRVTEVLKDGEGGKRNFC